jgi:hypothetical protein
LYQVLMMSGSTSIHGIATTSSTAVNNCKGKRLHLVDYPSCGVCVVMIRSKQDETYGEVFYKCPNNVKVRVNGFICYSRHVFCASSCS